MVDRLSILLGRISMVSLEDLKHDEGQTTVEYAVVLVLVIGLAIAAFAALTTGVSTFMSDIEGYLSSAAGAI